MKLLLPLLSYFFLLVSEVSLGSTNVEREAVIGTRVNAMIDHLVAIKSIGNSNIREGIQRGFIQEHLADGWLEEGDVNFILSLFSNESKKLGAFEVVAISNEDLPVVHVDVRSSQTKSIVRYFVEFSNRSPYKLSLIHI